MYKFTGFTEKANKALNSAVEIAENLGHTYIGSEHLLMGLIRDDNGIASRSLNSRGVNSIAVEKIVRKLVGVGIPTVLSPSDFTPRCKSIIESSVSFSKDDKSDLIGTHHLLLGIVKEPESCACFVLSQLDVNTNQVENELKFGTTRDTTSQGTNEGKKSGKSQTPNLDKFGQDLTQKARNMKLDPVIAREKEIERVIQILVRRGKNNPCLIGEPGVGKTAIAEGLALKLAQGEVPEILSGKKIVSLDLTSMVAGTKYRGDFEERIKNCIEEVVKSKDIILFIDEVHNLIGTGSAEGAVDAANILKPSLARSEIQVIGATTLNEYKKHIEKDSALERRFQPIHVHEPSEKEAIEIICGIKDKYELHHKISIDTKCIETAVNLSVRYINDRFLPDKAIDLLDEACSRVRLRDYILPPEIKELELKLKEICEEKSNCIDNQNFELAARLRDKEKVQLKKITQAKIKWKEESLKTSKVLLPDDVFQIVSSWTGIPLTQITKKQSERLLGLEKDLHKSIIGQDKAVAAVAKAIRRSRSGVKDPTKPLGSFIFLGPTGVGKTELCKALALCMFGDENSLLRFDMSEFVQKQSSSKLIGSPPGYVGYEDSGQLTEKVRRKPYSIVLFDEIEKADPEIFSLLLQILDDGKLTDSQGRKVDFRNTVIIMTSNLGAKLICGDEKSIGFTTETAGVLSETTVSSAVMKELKNTFKPEFLNRVDEMIVFHKLSSSEMKEITKVLLEKLSQRLIGIDIFIDFSDEVIDFISQTKQTESYGARPLKRAIQTHIEDSLSEEILKGEVKPRVNYICKVKDKSIHFEKVDNTIKIASKS